MYVAKFKQVAENGEIISYIPVMHFGSLTNTYMGYVPGPVETEFAPYLFAASSESATEFYGTFIAYLKETEVPTDTLSEYLNNDELNEINVYCDEYLGNMNQLITPEE